MLHNWCNKEGRKEIFYLTTHSTHFIYGYMASDIWLRTILIVKKETHCRHMGYSFRLTARVLLYAPSHIQYSTYHSLCYTSRGALAWCNKSCGMCYHLCGKAAATTTFSNEQQGIFYMYHPIDRIAHTMTFVILVMKYWQEQ